LDSLAGAVGRIEPTSKGNESLMVYKGIEFNIIQGIERDVWKWSVSTNGSQAKAGQTKTKPHAVMAAWRAIDKALEREQPHVAAIVR
jgi:hypothetical protein